MDRNDSFDNMIDCEILSERDIGQYNTAKPNSRVKIFPGKKNKESSMNVKYSELKSKAQGRRNNRLANKTTMGLATALDYSKSTENTNLISKFNANKTSVEQVDVYT